MISVRLDMNERDKCELLILLYLWEHPKSSTELLEYDFDRYYDYSENVVRIVMSEMQSEYLVRRCQDAFAWELTNRGTKIFLPSELL